MGGCWDEGEDEDAQVLLGVALAQMAERTFPSTPPPTPTLDITAGAERK